MMGGAAASAPTAALGIIHRDCSCRQGMAHGHGTAWAAVLTATSLRTCRAADTFLNCCTDSLHGIATTIDDWTAT